MSGTEQDAPSPPANAASATALTLVEELWAAGVRDAVLAPGSRSAPLAFALHLSDAAGLVRLHTRIDERSAGFVALGLAKTSRRPVVVVTTSGTAVANLHPAVLEASHAGVPLLVLSADRPSRLRGTQANQTTEQVGLLGGAPRLVLDLPAGSPGSTAHERAQVGHWRELARRAVATASASDGRPEGPGPVQLNVQLDGPLVPGTPDGWSTALTRVEPVRVEPSRSPPGRAATGLPRGPRTVVVAGEDAGPPARVLAERADWPLLAEPTSGSRTGGHAIRAYRLLLADPALRGSIERVVVLGHPTLSRPVTGLLTDPDLELLVVRNPTGWTDPARRAVHLDTVPEIEPGTGPEAARDAEWLARWHRRDAEVSARLDTLLAARPLTPHAVAGAVARALPAHGLLYVGASNPVRDLDLMVPRYAVGQHRLVVGSRGLAGIDGAVSTAIGAALGRPRTTRAYALLGDVTFLHDANGLLLGPDEPRPDLTVVVVNDDGGSVFASLEQGGPDYADSYERLFGTPHHVDLAALCAATRTPHWRVDTLAELEHALASPAGGLEVVEAVVGRRGRRELDAAVRALAD